MVKYTDTQNPFTIEKPDLEDRKKESAQVRSKHGDRVPVIIYTDDKQLVQFLEPQSDGSKPKCKYLVSEDITLAQFTTIIRKRIKLTKEQAIWLYVGGDLPPTSSSLSSLYQDSKQEDGFLYIRIVGENTFG